MRKTVKKNTIIATNNISQDNKKQIHTTNLQTYNN